MKNMTKNVYVALPLFTLVFLTNCGGPADKKPESKAAPMSQQNNIISLPSGLRYEIINNAEGASPKKGQTVRVHYTGYLNDGKDGLGKKFDSSVDRGQPFEFPLGLGYVIKGWDEGLALMKVGQKVRLYIPAPLGYGERGAGAAIPPRADLIFDVEFLGIR